jgi:hypothetical protein
MGDYSGMLPLAPGNTNRVGFRQAVRLRLFDRRGQPAAGVAFQIDLGDGSAPSAGTTDDGGDAVFYAAATPATCTVSWGSISFSEDDGEGGPAPVHFMFTQQVALVLPDDATPDATRARLSNLGYSPLAKLEDCVRVFQSDHDLETNGDPAHAETASLLLQKHGEMTPAQQYLDAGLLPESFIAAVTGQSGQAPAV